MACLAMPGCGESDPQDPLPSPEVTLTAAEKEVWAKLPPDRSAIPVLVYHGIGPEGDFSSTSDAAYGVDTEAFATQMTAIRHAGYETVDLQTFIDFVSGEPVDLPARPLLLTFDDARANSWTGADGILRELHFNAVMFVDVGRVQDGHREYLTWEELQTMQDSGTWEMQLHSGDGHVLIRYGADPDETGPYYAYRARGEDLSDWRDRVRSDVEWGQSLLEQQVPDPRPLAFALPYGSYGQEGTNDERIPDDFLTWLTKRYPTVFTQDENALARAGSDQPLGRIQVTRSTTGGELHEMLLAGK